MPQEPSGTQRPLEIFGHPTTLPCPNDGHWEKIKAEDPRQPYRAFPCPFSKTNCIKIRKAKPNPLIGNCTARMASRGGDTDWIVCPKRFEQDDLIFQNCIPLLDVTTGIVSVGSEVELKEFGRLDFVVTRLSEEANRSGLVGIEVQGMGSSNSGGFWEARNDYLNGRFKTKYGFGMNVRDASKKIMVQVLHKGTQLARWGKKYVLVVQDHLLKHLRETYNLHGPFHEARNEDQIHIHSYTLNQNPTDGTWGLTLTEKISSDVTQLHAALAINPNKNYVAFGDIHSTLLDKKSAGKLIEITDS